MKRRNFFKKIAGVIAGLVIAPFVIEAKESDALTLPEIAARIESDKWPAHPYKDNLNWVEIHKRIVTNPNQFEFGDPKDYRMVLFTAEGEAYESKDIILK